MKNELIKKLLTEIQKYFLVGSVLWKETEYIKSLLDENDIDEDLY